MNNEAWFPHRSIKFRTTAFTEGQTCWPTITRHTLPAPVRGASVFQYTGACTAPFDTPQACRKSRKKCFPVFSQPRISHRKISDQFNAWFSAMQISSGNQYGAVTIEPNMKRTGQMINACLAIT
jgi:hypothetical protein